MNKKQIIEIICIVAGFALIIKVVDYLQFVVSGIFQLISEQGYAQLYYFFIYLISIVVYFVVAYILITKAGGISREISKRLDPADLLIDLNAPSALQYSIFILGGITLVSGLSSFLTNLITTLTMSGELGISWNMIWLHGLIKMILGLLAIIFAKPISKLIK